MGKDKITVVGAGNVGATTAYIAATRRLGEIVLLDIVKGLPDGKALDMAEASPIDLSQQEIVGTTDWSATAGSDVVIITSGVPRKPGMSRDDLLATNARIVRDVSQKVAEYSPDAICDRRVQSARCDGPRGREGHRLSHAPRDGNGGGPGFRPFQLLPGRRAGRQRRGCQVRADGRPRRRHGPLAPFHHPSAASRSANSSNPTGSTQLIDRARKGGIEIVNLLGYSAYYAPAAGAVKMAEAILRDTKNVICCCAYCDKQYNAGGYFVGVPAVLGKGGVERIIELDLNESEKKQFAVSLGHVKELVTQVDKLAVVHCEDLRNVASDLDRCARRAWPKQRQESLRIGQSLATWRTCRPTASAAGRRSTQSSWPIPAGRRRRPIPGS